MVLIMGSDFNFFKITYFYCCPRRVLSLKNHPQFQRYHFFEYSKPFHAFLLITFSSCVRLEHSIIGIEEFFGKTWRVVVKNRKLERLLASNKRWLECQCISLQMRWQSTDHNYCQSRKHQTIHIWRLRHNIMGRK